LDWCVERPCPSDPRFPRFEDYELRFHHRPDELRMTWSCLALPKTEMARKLSLGSGFGVTKEEAERWVRGTYERYAHKDGW
jgi:hypothetical protein